jgi:hypothetical protein
MFVLEKEDFKFSYLMSDELINDGNCKKKTLE